MDRRGADPKVKKTLVRNCEQKIRTATRKDVVYATSTRQTKSASEMSKKSSDSLKENKLAQPSLCTSETIANYLCEIANIRPPLSTESGNLNNKDSIQISSKITKKLNFHTNERMFKDLVELNASVDNIKLTNKDKKPATNTIKRDVEPKIEDFYLDEKEADSPPNIPTIKLKFKPIKNIPYGQLHNLVARYDDL